MILSTLKQLQLTDDVFVMQILIPLILVYVFSFLAQFRRGMEQLGVRF